MHQPLHSIVFPPLAPGPREDFIELRLRLECTRAQARNYLYSKLYYATAPREPFSEDRVICFPVGERNRFERIQVALPASDLRRARDHQFLKVRVDGLPYSEGTFSVEELRLVDDSVHPELSRLARLAAQRQWVREQVLISEAERRVFLPHYPESLSLELTTVCNLQCPHCSAHGLPQLHRHHNGMAEMSIPLLDQIAAEAFGHATAVSIVGRGEPTVASDALWERFTELLRHHNVRLSCVSNGTRIQQRFDAALMPYVHELCFSVDGATPETYETNRRGARFEAVLDNIRYYHDLRTRLPLARRPQLSFSWTLKKNNIQELPRFVELIAECEPDLVSIRHMVIFQDKDKPQSLLDDPQLTNRFLSAAYAALDERGIRHESPPLIIQASETQESDSATSDEPVVPRENVCNWMHRTAIIMADGEVTTCGKHYGIRVGVMSAQQSLHDIWNGPAMRSLRESFGTSRMWDQCRACWLREIKWHSQRQAKDNQQEYSLEEGMDFSESAWDYRSYEAL
ncbi:MAG: radical SAM protein [Candidatus Contendobacter sp.]|nr:radical SAM protein [Candidatus Contendobacter sp.]